jgi:hypothetical protein
VVPEPSSNRGKIGKTANDEEWIHEQGRALLNAGQLAPRLMRCLR